MNSTVKYSLYFIFGFILILLIQNAIPKPINWDRSFKTSDKIPYGLYILDQELPHLLAPSTIEKYNKTPYEYYNEKLDTVHPQKETWFFVMDNADIDEASVNKILKAAN